jgi:NADPH-dependent ferric siderophore reductase
VVTEPLPAPTSPSTDEPPRRRRRGPQPLATTVLRTERLTPALVRVVVGGDEVAGFGGGEFTDRYVKLLFADRGGDVAAGVAAIRAGAPREAWPHLRTYTVRTFDPAAGELAIDFVVHGDEGLAGPWADRARAGDTLWLANPSAGGAYAPDPGAEWHLLAGDESALPAIASALEALPAGASAQVLVEVEDAAGELALRTHAAVEVHWLHRSAGRGGSAGALAVLDPLGGPAGPPQVFIHGEADTVRDLRRAVRARWDVPGDALSVSGYWRRGRTEEGWRADKADWTRAVESDDASSLPTDPPVPSGG